jgi:hypothetical protein
MPLPETIQSWERVQRLERECATIGELDPRSPLHQALEREWDKFISLCQRERAAAGDLPTHL